jgi:hypothetical protein
VYTVSRSLVNIAVGLEGCSVEFQAGGLGLSSDEEFTSWCVIYMEGRRSANGANGAKLGHCDSERESRHCVTVTYQRSASALSHTLRALLVMKLRGYASLSRQVQLQTPLSQLLL